MKMHYGAKMVEIISKPSEVIRAGNAVELALHLAAGRSAESFVEFGATDTLKILQYMQALEAFAATIFFAELLADKNPSQVIRMLAKLGTSSNLRIQIGQEHQGELNEGIVVCALHLTRTMTACTSFLDETRMRSALDNDSFVVRPTEAFNLNGEQVFRIQVATIAQWFRTEHKIDQL